MSRFPFAGRVFSIFRSADKALRDAAIIWIANQIELYEGERRLENHELQIGTRCLAVRPFLFQLRLRACVDHGPGIAG